MWEFRFYSRGGQGAVTAAKILTNAAIIEGKFAQAIPSYGQERKGAPIHTYGRISDEPIEVKSYVYRPNCVICFDTSLAEVGIDITELEKLREVKKNISDPDLRKKLDEEIKKSEEEYVKRSLATNVAEENKKEREKRRDEALEIVDAVAFTLKKLVKWAYRH